MDPMEKPAPLPRVRVQVHRPSSARSSGRLRVFGDWNDPTGRWRPLQAVIAREFGRFVGRDRSCNKGLKPVHWCMHCKTGAGTRRVEYEDQPRVGLREVPDQDGSRGLVRAVGARARTGRSRDGHCDRANLAIAVHPPRRTPRWSSTGQALIVAQPLLEASRYACPGVKGRGNRRLRSRCRGRRSRAWWPPPVDRSRRPPCSPRTLAMDAGTRPGPHRARPRGGRLRARPPGGAQRSTTRVNERRRFIAEVLTRGARRPGGEPAHHRGTCARPARSWPGPLQHTYPHSRRCKKPTLFSRQPDAVCVLRARPSASGRGARRVRNEVTIGWGEDSVRVLADASSADRCAGAGPWATSAPAGGRCLG